jgi:hypothetical protein
VILKHRVDDQAGADDDTKYKKDAVLTPRLVVAQVTNQKPEQTENEEHGSAAAGRHSGDRYDTKSRGLQRHTAARSTH